jgi:hypothetical protein
VPRVAVVLGNQLSERRRELGEGLETLEGLQTRLCHLGYLGEELAEVVAASPAASAWLYRVIAAEAGEVVRIAGAYIAECERPHGARDGGGAL